MLIVLNHTDAFYAEQVQISNIQSFKYAFYNNISNKVKFMFFHINLCVDCTFKIVSSVSVDYMYMIVLSVNTFATILSHLTCPGPS